MTLEPVGELVVLTGLSGDVALLSGDVEIVEAGRRTANLAGETLVEFGPGRRDWRVTGFAVFVPGGSRLFTKPLEEPVTVRAGQAFSLEIAASARLA